MGQVRNHRAFAGGLLTPIQNLSHLGEVFFAIFHRFEIVRTAGYLYCCRRNSIIWLQQQTVLNFKIEISKSFGDCLSLAS